MRKLILSIQMSLDGFIEGPQGDISWIKTNDDDEWEDYFDMLQSVDLLVLGRVTFPDYRDHWKNALTSVQASANEVQYAQYAANTPHIVFSSRMHNPDWSNTTVIKGNVIGEIKRLKAQPGKDIQVVGGARLAATVIEGGLVDEYRFVINPVILGNGKSLFQEQHGKHNLDLVSSRALQSGRLIVRFARKLLVPKSVHGIASSHTITPPHHN